MRGPERILSLARTLLKFTSQGPRPDLEWGSVMKLVLVLFAIIAGIALAVGLYHHAEAPLNLAKVLSCVAVLGWASSLFNDAVDDLRFRRH